ncbi:unnamed protein product [Microthlaspi erraticum]|uniref:F-box associated beta-propeller type 1 domain-containing protein n=1 Tax=Microthlaspi erraticum TaxID=1685480 RepID=A0A6D2L2G3_9BRAS|nr:unnamed protein product [Microthlaspi erraticum]
MLRLLNDPHGRSVFEIYDFSSDSWRLLDLTPDFKIEYDQSGETLKGNAYFKASVTIFGPMNKRGRRKVVRDEEFLVCFDFTRERFGKRLPVPINSYSMPSCVRGEQLAVLYREETGPSWIYEIWVTNKI